MVKIKLALKARNHQTIFTAAKFVEGIQFFSRKLVYFKEFLTRHAKSVNLFRVNYAVCTKKLFITTYKFITTGFTNFHKPMLAFSMINVNNHYLGDQNGKNV